MGKNNKLLLKLVIFAAVMVGVAYAFVPLYRMFCQLIGIPVTTIAVGNEGKAKPLGEKSERMVTVRFMANVADGAPMKLEPSDKKLKMHLNEPALTSYNATNFANREIHGTAVHTIVAFGSGGEVDVTEYVDLQQCFCFEEQLYPANKEVQLPLSFHVTEDLPKDIHTIIFAYTLYEVEGK